ncbi:outer membrane porin GjpA [Mycolicibacterium farcinogenes]|uniref:Outer membrane porin GjpA n=2 Tax=Mycolicibacterium farcinogenes TaxID=1802 RepID=A0ACD1FH41_MYCFR|nr:outer membrane porin GjpA [Mycolicibacterium farcinogenes]QZH66369.1 outer membrane porin GjpA [Mycolicibacterium farcinogenes]QZH69394.1 outer membrane porin GjpA [Mycolicibacterium farcinogenes]
MTAGVAMAAAGAVAFTPLTMPPPDVQIAANQPVTASVELTAAADFLTRWAEVFNDTAANATKVSEFYSKAPAAALQQAIVNQIDDLRAIINDPASIGDVISANAALLQDVIQATTFSGDPFGYPPVLSPAFEALEQTLDPQHMLMLLAINGWPIPMELPEIPAAVASLLNFAASPLSGALIGVVGPMLSPGVAALNSVLAGDLLNLPANVVDGFFNGATLNLDAALPLISGSLPPGMDIKSLSIELGGLFSTGSVGNDAAPGGSIFNAVTLVLDRGNSDLTFAGHRLGPIAALANLSQIIAKTTGWDGTGNPLDELSEPASGTTTAVAAKAEDGPAALPSAPRKLAALNVSSDGAPEVKSLSLAEAPAVDNDTEADAAKAVEVSTESGIENSAEGATGQVVRESPKAEPGKIGTARVKPSAKLKESIDSVGGKVNSTVKKVRDGLKSGFSKPAKKNSVAGTKKSAGSDGAGAAGSGGDSDK